MGLCSKCYQEKLKQEGKSTQEDSAALERVSIQQETNLKQDSNPEKSTSECLNPTAAASVHPPTRSRKTRCAECKKKLGLNGFKCKCGLMFCGEHRHAEGHNCNFDHKATEREYLAGQNPVVQGDKLDRLL